MAKKESKEFISTQGKPLPEGIKLEDLKHNYDIMISEYKTAINRMKVLDMADTGKIWSVICQKFPEYQISPDTNYINYIKENIVASVYTVGKSASLLARSKAEEETVNQLNKVLEIIWGVLDVPSYQLKAGERAALMNLGITQVGWASDMTGGTHESWYKGELVFKNIDPMCYGRDPFAEELDDAGWVIFHDRFHRNTLMENKDYVEALKQYKPDSMDQVESYHRDIGRNPTADSNYYHLVIHWVKHFDEDKGEVVIHEVHTIDNKYVIYVKEDIKPSIFPFAELHSNVPSRDPIGISEPAKALSSTIVLNLLDGITVTHAYKAQRPPRLISDRSGLNLRAFQKYGNDPDKAFIVRGNASDAVQYVQFPNLPQGLDAVAMRLSGAIERLSGIDGKYTGKDTGSILTTGGIDSMLAQATMRDTTRIRLYEAYTRRLTRLTIQHLLEFADKRAYTYKKPTETHYETVEVNFPDIPEDILFNYSIDISTDIPKNKAKLAAAADAALERQMQYGGSPEIITIEEWISYQDFPQKGLMLERIEIDREANMAEQVTEILSMFAALVENGMDPQEAIQVVTQQMQAQQTPGGQGKPPGQ